MTLKAEVQRTSHFHGNSYLVVMELEHTGKVRATWPQRWKRALNGSAITFNGRLSAHSH